jgi:hypothetical protein
MVPAQGWRLTDVGRGTDESGRPMVTLRFDNAGAMRLLQLTQANGGKSLAEMVDGVVVSAPRIQPTQTGLGSAVIGGNLDEQELESMMATLRRGRVGQSASTDAGPPVSEPDKAVDVLAFRIAPRPEEVGLELVEKYKQALTGGGRPPGSDYAWFEIRPGAYEPVALDGRTGVAANPQFVAPTAKDFSLRADSPARRQGIGVADPVSFPSPWPLQPEESAIIPQGDTRDYRQWRDPAQPKL